jgi:hypothetical protein
MASEHRRAIGIFPDRPRTASALQALSDSKFSMDNVSVIAKETHRQDAIAGVEVKPEAVNHADDGGAVGAVTGGVLGGVTGLLVGLGTLTIPGIGPVLLAGEAATAIATLVGVGAGAAAGGLLGALVGMGIPEHRARHYQDRVAQGDYLIILKDTDLEIARAEKTLKDAGIQDWGVYTTPDSTQQSVTGKGTAIDSVTASDGTTGGVDRRRGNPYNQVDHPTHQYGDRDQTPATTGLPHASNPISESDSGTRR